MDTIIDTLLELDELNQEEVDRLRNLIPDIIVETPRTTLAIVRLQKILSSCKDYVKSIILNMLVSSGCDIIKKFFDL